MKSRAGDLSLHLHHEREEQCQQDTGKHSFFGEGVFLLFACNHLSSPQPGMKVSFSDFGTPESRQGVVDRVDVRGEAVSPP
jgi:hypothetical protein